MKNFKIMSLMSVAFVSVLGAEVKKSPELLELERQNRLLKMQIENKKLQMELEDVEISNASNGSHVVNETLETKNGFFLGLEMEFSSVSLRQIEPFPITGYEGEFNIGLDLGYQHYFDKEQQHGLRTQFVIKSGIPANTSGVNGLQSGNIDRILVGLGFELGYAWDFVRRGKHTFGLDAGIGYDLNINLIETQFNSGLNIYSNSISLLTHNFYPKIGLHYFYGKHQLQLTYKLGGAIGPSTATESTSEKQKIEVGTYTSYLNLGYSYRF